MNGLSFLLIILLIHFAIGCKEEEPDCVQFLPIDATHVPFMFLDENSHENLVQDGFFDHPKRIHLDSLELFNAEMDSLSELQWILEDHGYGYLIFIYVFDQSKVPRVDTMTPGSVTYYIYSGNEDLDTIVFNYHFQPRKYCCSRTNDTIETFINGRPALFSQRAADKDVFAIFK